MGFFSKLFGKNEPAPAPVKPAVAAAPQPVASVAVDAQQIINLLGGRDNIADITTCAVTRIRVQIKAPIPVTDAELRQTGLSASMQINDQVIHLLAGLQAEAILKALKTAMAA